MGQGAGGGEGAGCGLPLGVTEAVGGRGVCGITRAMGFILFRALAGREVELDFFAVLREEKSRYSYRAHSKLTCTPTRKKNFGHVYPVLDFLSCKVRGGGDKLHLSLIYLRV